MTGAGCFVSGACGGDWGHGVYDSVGGLLGRHGWDDGCA